MKPSNSVKSQDGYVLLLALITSMALFIALSGILSLSMINLASVKRSAFDISAQYVAEAGIDKAVFEINNDPAYPGTNSACPIDSGGSSPVTLFDDSVKGKGTYETCTMAGTIPREIIVYAVGKVYATSTAAAPISTRKIKVTVQGSPAGEYAVQTGPGGMIMNNSATITNGSVYVGGYLTMNNSSRIGSATAPITVSVANARCPSPATATYPAICPNGTLPNPITINNTARIYGTVNANGQVNTAGMSHTGLAATSGVTAPALPGYDRDAHKAAVVTEMTGAAASCSGSSTVTWPANVKINGNVTMGNTCTIVVSGNAWITGTFTARQSSIIIPAAAVSTQPTIMIDGSGGVSLQHQAVVATNSGSVGMMMITFHSAASCSPDCSSVTGADLFNSQNLLTINSGNQGSAPGSVLYARWTKISVSQGGTIGAILGQTIELNNSGNLSFVNTVATGNYTYDIRHYELQ